MDTVKHGFHFVKVVKTDFILYVVRLCLDYEREGNEHLTCKAGLIFLILSSRLYG